MATAWIRVFRDLAFAFQPAGTSSSRAQLVVSALLHFNQDRYHLYAYVIMNDHVHVLVRPLGINDFGKVLHSWKSFTANQLQRKHRRKGSVWQKDTHTHIIRDEGEFYSKAEYILTNPLRRWPEAENYKWVDWLDLPNVQRITRLIRRQGRRRYVSIEYGRLLHSARLAGLKSGLHIHWSAIPYFPIPSSHPHPAPGPPECRAGSCVPR